MRISDWSSDVCSSDLHRQRGDVARVEIGSESYEIDGKYNGKPAAGFAIRLASGANALDTVEALHAQVEQIGKTLPRSEEHTSELQSLMRISYAVFCLKKQKNTTTRSLIRTLLENVLQKAMSIRQTND